MTNAHQYPKVGVLCGGISSERGISLKSGRAVYEGLKAAKVPAQLLTIDTADEQKVLRVIEETGAQIVFIALHGRFGEDGALQAILERRGIAYTGSGSQACRLTIDKIATQRFLHQNGFRIPSNRVVSRRLRIPTDQVAVEIHRWPIVVKPAREGSSFGVSLVSDPGQLDKALTLAFEFDENVLIEDYIEGQEITVGILAGEPLPLVEIRSSHEFFDYQAKYQKGLTEYIVPATLSPEVTQKVQKDAVSIFNLLGCRDFGRLDFICDKEGQPYFLELNAIPGFTETSLLPKAAQQAGIKFPELCRRIVSLAFNRISEVPTNG